MDQQAYPNLSLESLLSSSPAPLDVVGPTSIHISQQRSASNRKSVLLGVPVQHGNGTDRGYVPNTQFGQSQRNLEPTYVIPSTSSNRSEFLPEQLQSCQLCKWHSYDPNELLHHMREYHHIDTDHVVSNQIGGSTSDSIGQGPSTRRSFPFNDSTQATTTSSTTVNSQPSVSTEVEHLISIMNGNLECKSESGGEAVFICLFCKLTFKKKKPAEAHMWIEHIRSEWAEASGNENVDEVYLQYLEVQFTRLESDSASSSSKETRNKRPPTPPPPPVTRPEPALSSTSESRAVKFIRPDGEEFFCTVCKIRATRAHRLIGHIITVHFGSDEVDKGKNQRKSRNSATLQRPHTQGGVTNFAPLKRRRGRPRRRLSDINSGVESLSEEVIDCLPNDPDGLQNKFGRPSTNSLTRIGNGIVRRKHTDESLHILGSKEAQKVRSNVYVDANGRLQKKRGRPFSRNLAETPPQIGSPNVTNDEKSSVPDASSCKVGRYKFFKCDGCGQLFSKMSMLRTHKSNSCGNTIGVVSNQDQPTDKLSTSKALSDAVTKKYRFTKRTSHGLSLGTPVKRRKFRHPKRKTYNDDAKRTKRSPPMSPSRGESTIATKSVRKKSESAVVTKSACEKSETAAGIRRRGRPTSQKKVQSIKRKTKTNADVTPEIQNTSVDQKSSLDSTDRNTATILYECKLCTEKFLGQPLFKYHLVSVHYGEIKSFDIVDSIIAEMGREIVEKQAELPGKAKTSATRKKGPHKRRRSQIQRDTQSQPNFDDIISRRCVVSIEKLRWNGPLPNCLVHAAMDLCVKVSPKIFRCKNCGDKFRCFSECFSHSRATHYGERRNQCHVCSKYFTDESFQNHILSCGVKK